MYFLNESDDFHYVKCNHKLLLVFRELFKMVPDVNSTFTNLYSHNGP